MSSILDPEIARGARARKVEKADGVVEPPSPLLRTT